MTTSRFLLAADEALTPESVEYVTIKDDIAVGIDYGNASLFPDLRSALDHARTLPDSERASLFARSGEKVQALNDAEASLRSEEK